MATINLYNALDSYSLSKQDLRSHKSLQAKLRAIKKHLPDRPLHELTTFTIDDWLIKRRSTGVQPQTIKHEVIHLRAACRWAQGRGYRVNDIVWPKMRIDNARIRALSAEEEKALLEELCPHNQKYLHKLTSENLRARTIRARQENYDFVILLIDLGVRYSELATLTWDRVELKTGLIQVRRSKTCSESVLMLSHRAKRILKRRYHNRHPQFVFTNEAGTKHRGHRTVGIKTALKNAQIHDFKVHDFRHTHASRLVRNGLTLQETAHMLGHKSIISAHRYAHLEHIQTAKKAVKAINSINVN